MNMINTETQTQFWQQLKQDNLLVGDSMPSHQMTHQLWYVRVMLGFAGWLGALFLLGFVAIGLEFIMKNAAAAILTGSLFCAAAYALFRMVKNKDNDFLEQFGLAVSLAGQGMLCVGWYQQFEDSKQLLFIVAFAIEVLLVWVMANSIHRFLSTVAALFAMSLFLKEYAIHDIMLGAIAAGVVCIWLSNKVLVKPLLWAPIAYGFVCALLWFEIGRMTPLFRSTWSGDYYWWLRYAWWSGMLIATMVWLVATSILLKRQSISLQSKQAYCAFAASIAIGVASYFVSGIASAALVLILGFAIGNRVLFGLGVLGFIGFLSHYYYQMQATLLYKSAVLAMMGVFLLAIRFAFQRYLISGNGIGKQEKLGEQS
jgi:uncharacterized membrane protein